jgi:hypothetical protein
VLLLKYAPEMENEMKSDISEDQLVYLKSIVAKEGSGITSKALEALLGAYTKTGQSAVSELPLELALITILKENL